MLATAWVKTIGTLLIEQRCDVSALLGMFVEGARLFPWLNDAVHGMVAYFDRHVVDGGILWQRESVHDFDFLWG